MIVRPVQPGGLITKYFMACEYYELLTLAIEMLNMAYDRTAFQGVVLSRGELVCCQDETMSFVSGLIREPNSGG
jgi:hypothetical protein